MCDGIIVIEQTTAEREQETIDLFNEIRPLLDSGYSYHSALRKIGKMHQKWNNDAAWLRDLRKYGETQGYPFDEYSGRGFKK